MGILLDNDNKNDSKNDNNHARSLLSNNNNDNNISWTRESKLLVVNLTIPTLIIQLGTTVPSFLTASYIGRQFGAVYLDGFTLAINMANLFNLSLLQGLYSASDTLSPQAFGAGNYKQVGLLALRGFISSLFVLIPINIFLIFGFGPLMRFVGEDPEAAVLSHQWYQIYACSLPFYALFCVTWKFLSAQDIMKPLVWVSLVCCLIVLPLSLEIGTRTLGYYGTAVALATYQSSQAILLILYLKWKRPHHPETWTGLAWKEAIEWDAICHYFLLGMGGMLATSEWIYFECVTLVVGTLGVIPLSVHTIPTQVITIGFMLPLSIGISLSVRLGVALPQNVYMAQQLTIRCLLCSTVLIMILCIWLYFDQERVISLFTTDPDVIHGCKEIWISATIFFFNVSIYGVNIGIATGLGMQWFFGIVTILCLWGFSLPGIYYFAIYQQGGITTAWSWIYRPYVVMNFIFLYAFWSKDWYQVQREIQIREGMVSMDNSVTNKNNVDSSSRITKDDSSTTIVNESSSLL